MRRPIDDVRIREVRPLLPAQLLAEELPVPEATAELVDRTRADIERVLLGKDDRLVVVVGPCSIHDPAAALDYAARLQEAATGLTDALIVVMRAYFEKPRTSVGWKGLINDPDLDDSCRINKGLRLARKLLLDLGAMGVPAATEFLDTTVPQHIAELVSWGAIGARTTESQIHRALASGLSMPVGFKNNTEGSVRAAVDAILSAQSGHWFPSTTKQGVAAISHTAGNPFCHVILRGGSKSGPNYDATHVDEARRQMEEAGLRANIMIDCSHGNSLKQPARQLLVAEDVAAQLASGDRAVMGVMLESHLVGGRQDEPTVYGQSITDACLSFEETTPALERLADAVQARRSL